MLPRLIAENLLQLPIAIAFVSLLGATIAHPSSRKQLQTKSLQDWLLDISGLLLQGIAVPLLQTTLMLPLWQWLLPNWQHRLQLPFLPAFLLSFVVVDYLYYWNHRWLHKRMWRSHQVHHTVTQMDVLGTSRNTLWTSLLIIYLWIHPLFLHLLAHPIGYLLGVSLTAVLDLWRHSRWTIASRWLSSWLILPQDHAWHHASAAFNCNYGANLKLWDRLHHTDYDCDRSPVSIGTSTDLTLTQKLLFPFP